jgi:glyoxylase-like metal-dependent hydrolase (beta-lactamase superfamily II)
MLFSVLVLLGLVALAYLPSYAGPLEQSATGMTRGEVVAKVVDYFGWPHQSEYNDIWKVPAKKLSDVKTADKYGKQLETAYEIGLIVPDALAAFNPNNPISRQDAAAILAKAFMLPEKSDVLASLTDKPNDPLTAADFDAVFKKITSTVVAPVQALPLTNAVAPRRYVKLWTPTEGTTIFYTTDGSTPTTSSKIYTIASTGHVNEMLSDAQLPERDVVYKAIAVKGGVSSPVQTFKWRLYRPKTAEFASKLIQAKTATAPAVYELWADAESVRAMAWYIEGQDKGILFDALQTPPEQANLKDYIDKNIAKKPYIVIIGHEHGDHDAQAPNFLKAGIDVYANKRGWSTLGVAGTFPAVFATTADQAKIKNVDEGDVFQLGGVTLNVYALPGHANGNVLLHDPVNGLLFASDIYGCTRAGSADNVAVSGVRADLLLSLAQQVHSAYKKNGGKLTMLFTGHDETPLEADAHLTRFEQALQKVVDYGDAGASPTLRGNNNRPGSRTVLIGDMWRDGTNWISLLLAGVVGDNTEYLTSSPINYNGNGFNKYAVLSNIEFEGAELVGTTVKWSAPPPAFTWAGISVTVPSELPNKFDPWAYEYSVKVPKDKAKITVIPTSMSTRSTVMLNGAWIENKSRNGIPVSDGAKLNIKLVAPDSVTTGVYTFTLKTQ